MTATSIVDRTILVAIGIGLVMCMVLSACSPITDATPHPQPGAPITQAAWTAAQR